MILCTAYGLLIYECHTVKTEPPAPVNSSVPEEQKDKKQKKRERDQADQPKINVTAQYKLSVLPNERVLDCLSLGGGPQQGTAGGAGGSDQSNSCLLYTSPSPRDRG